MSDQPLELGNSTKKLIKITTRAQLKVFGYIICHVHSNRYSHQLWRAREAQILKLAFQNQVLEVRSPQSQLQAIKIRQSQTLEKRATRYEALDIVRRNHDLLKVEILQTRKTAKIQRRSSKRVKFLHEKTLEGALNHSPSPNSRINSFTPFREIKRSHWSISAAQREFVDWSLVKEQATGYEIYDFVLDEGPIVVMGRAPVIKHKMGKGSPFVSPFGG
ncbi:endosomal targeting BRO1-like domain-containing protein [Striga asiatica]|uniref:Endosomal targeting BRO1-like domain-containing protein n=1 Tax=Striga asiatica TaxID=4170 RepID=A0A5A7PGW2_STRAF|nr:endosomal targeting BRO1-like domain-containing protein [Striga asiatica]